MLGDLISTFPWWFVLFAIGIINFPLTHLFFKKFFDAGYALSKIFGILIISYMVFFLAIFHILPFYRSVIFLTIAALAAGNFYLYKNNKNDLKKKFLDNIRVIIFSEVLFTFGFILWTIVRGYQPDINGLEKFMDYGFVNSALNSKFLPPADMWFAGKTINYYWYGHYITALLTKLSGLSSRITYNLMLATILGLALSATFSVVTSLVSFLKDKVNKRTIYFAGLISAFLLSFGGNFHTPYYVLKEGAQNYWYPDATRFIGYNPDVDDKTIHEFPHYSFVVADLHAHLINFPFVIFYIGVLWMIFEKGKKAKIQNLILPGFVLGTMFMTSTWDFANYSLLTGITFLISSIKQKRFTFEALINTAIFSGTIVFVGLITAVPFIINFESIAQGVKLVHSHSPLWQLSILWGFPFILTVVFLATLKKLKNKIELADLFALGLLISSWILIALPEIIYVKDIYIASHYRANTMFKLTYQAFVMSYLSSGYIIIRVLSSVESKVTKVFIAIFFSAILTSLLIYPYFATGSYYGKLKDYRGIDGVSWLSLRYPNEYKAYLWIVDNVPDQEVVLEAPGDSYTDFNVISSYSGYPTVSGWFVHEWLWRGDSKYPQERVTDISQIYTTTDPRFAKVLLDKYKVKYIIIGTFEHQKFPELTEAKFNQIGSLVFTSGATKIYKIN